MLMVAAAIAQHQARWKQQLHRMRHNRLEVLFRARQRAQIMGLLLLRLRQRRVPAAPRVAV
jgi:hypothetical protein